MTLNFTVGPVQSEEYLCCIAGEQVPYFRNEYFSNIVLESEILVKKFLNAANEDRVLFITGSGTASMEASVVNIFSHSDKLLVINGGTFGSRFADICKANGYDYVEKKVSFGSNISMEELESIYQPDITGLLVNVCETSSGVRYDMDVISTFCKEHKLLLIADIISSFLADENDMSRYGVDAYIVGSQKALACQPGVSIIVLSERAVNRIINNDPGCYYLDLRRALKDALRGQTPFTPAVGIIRQIHAKLVAINNNGVTAEMNRIKNNAMYVRDRVTELPFQFVTSCSSNSVTALYSGDYSAQRIIHVMKEEYDVWLCPNGGEYVDTVFRIGHIGDINMNDNEYMIDCLKNTIKLIS